VEVPHGLQGVREGVPPLRVGVLGRGVGPDRRLRVVAQVPEPEAVLGSLLDSGEMNTVQTPSSKVTLKSNVLSVCVNTVNPLIMAGAFIY